MVTIKVVDDNDVFIKRYGDLKGRLFPLMELLQNSAIGGLTFREYNFRVI